ncbi:hypothetical protein [Planktotalea frisia]|uniref:hypothetical protein n=1 Tax=Planktotalea frisia TaxID=696762 RepID=UPI0023525490|nr:hypothetical protein [Planktotalea frisia]
MTQKLSTLRNSVFTAAVIALAVSLPASAEMAGSLKQIVNTFQNGQATRGAEMAVDAKSAVTITDGVELPGFAFHVYDVDATGDSVTMTLVAKLEKLMVTKYDETTFDRYYIELDREVTSAEIAASSDENFSASVEILAPGTQVTAAGAFVEGLASAYTFENGAILVTVGDGTDLTKIIENNGSLTVNF